VIVASSAPGAAVEAALDDGLTDRPALLLELGDVREEDDAVEDGDAKSAMKPTEAGTER